MGTHLLERCIQIQNVDRPAIVEAIQPDIILVFSKIYDTHPKPAIVTPEGVPSGRSIADHALGSLAYYQNNSSKVIVIDSLPAVEGPNTPASCLAEGRDDCDFTPLNYATNIAVNNYAASHNDVTAVFGLH